MRMTRISSALFIVGMVLVAACGPQSPGGAPAPVDTTANDTVADTLNLK